MSEYPKYLYGAAGSRLVRDKAQEAELGEGWFDSPAKVAVPEVAIPEEPAKVAPVAEQDDEPLEEIESEALAFFSVEKGELLADCERNGIEADKRWGTKKLKKALANK